MKHFIIYAHNCINGQVSHVPYTRTYSETIEDGVRNFCTMLYRRGMTDANQLCFCLQEVQLQDDQSYDLVGEMLSVQVCDIAQGTFNTIGHDHA